MKGSWIYLFVSFNAVLVNFVVAAPLSLLNPVSLSTEWQTIEFDERFTDAAIFASLPTVIGTGASLFDEYTFEIRNVVSGNTGTKGQFQARINTTNEFFTMSLSTTASFLVAQKGVHNLGGSLLEVGTFSGTGAEQSVAFTNTGYTNEPTLLFQQQTKDDTLHVNNDWEVTKGTNLTSAGFSVTRQMQSAGLSTSVQETAYLALGQVSGSIDDGSLSLFNSNYGFTVNHQEKNYAPGTGAIYDLDDYGIFGQINGVLGGGVTDAATLTMTGRDSDLISMYINESPSTSEAHAFEFVSILGVYQAVEVSSVATHWLTFLVVLLMFMIWRSRKIGGESL